MNKHVKTLLVAVAALLSAAALAHGDSSGGSTGNGSGSGKNSHAAGQAKPEQQQVFGIAGRARAVRRTVDLTMSDDMRFTPDRIEVREGETLRLRLRNEGSVLHELVIGTPDELAAHAALMIKFPGMEHEDAHMAHVAPGQRGEIIWHFNRTGEFDFACLINGHFQAGMRGKLVVRPRATSNPK